MRGILLRGPARRDYNRGRQHYGRWHT